MIPRTLHKYAYVHGDPVNFSDPSGMFEISLVSLLWAVGITTALVGGGLLYSAYRRSYAIMPRMMELNLHVSTVGMPSVFNASNVEKKMQEYLDKKVFTNLISGQSVKVHIIPVDAPPSDLGWAGKPKDKYNGYIHWPKGTETFIAFSAQNETAIYEDKIRKEMSSVTRSKAVNWDQIYTNIILHEMIYLNAGGNTDDILSQNGDLASGIGDIDGFPDIRDETRIKIIKSYELTER